AVAGAGAHPRILPDPPAAPARRQQHPARRIHRADHRGAQGLHRTRGGMMSHVSSHVAPSCRHAKVVRRRSGACAMGITMGAMTAEAERWRSCTPRSASWWWNAIFWRKPSVDERGPEAGDDRTRTPAPVDRTAMRTGIDRPLHVLPRAGTGDGGEPAADAAARRAVPGNAVVWIAADDAASAPSGSRRRPQAGAAADGHDGSGTNLPAAADHGSASRAPDLPVSAARSRGRSAEPGLVRGYHLHSDASRLPLSGRGDGLVDAAGA